jgi:D-alanyl-lipoteichoic acid acyltransferase DltB (MBOAT superfamily)
LISSYFFYGYWDWRFCSLIFISTVVDYWVGRRLQETEEGRQRKLLLLISLSVNLTILGFFKYYNFFIDSASAILVAIGLEPHLPILKVALPVGISFYTFKTLTYSIEVYRRKISPTDSFIDYALFLSFFPQLLAGPIERAQNLLPQISTPRQITREKVLTGLNLILLGYFKKVAIADSLAPLIVKIYDAPEAMTSGQLWTGVYAYSFQIYGDFSGYTDIARGISRLLGFETMENFNAPYLSRNIAEFWRRWHISLSSWFRDYLYVPLGGNRRGLIRTYLNLIITMLLCGLWHGAAWTFVIWGIIHGLYLAGHRIFRRADQNVISTQKRFSKKMKDLFYIFITFHLVALAWVLFRSQSFEIAVVYFRGLFVFQQLRDISVTVLFAGCLLIALDIAQTLIGSQTWLTDRQKLKVVRYAVVQILLLSVLAAAIAHLGTLTPFIYFQF